MPGFVPNWGANVDWLNVKDFGAVGNGSHDDTSAIQACFNTAFGNYATGGHGQGAFTNKGVWFPAGNYVTTSPLYIVGVLGIRIEGQNAQIFYQGTGNEGNVLDTGNPTLTPMLMFDGVQNSRVSGISFAAPWQLRSNANFLGVYVYQSGTWGTSTAIDFHDCLFSNQGDGILANGVASCDNCMVYNTNFQNCGYNGIRLGSANVVNWQVYGGGASGCAQLSTFNPEAASSGNQGAAYSSGTGSFGVICGVSNTGNQWDVISSGAQQCAVIGGSFEGPQTWNIISTTWFGGTATLHLQIADDTRWGSIGGTVPITVLGVTNNNYNGSFTGTITAVDQITYPLANPGGSSSGGNVSRTDSGCIAANGSLIHVSGIAYRAGTSVVRMFDTTFSGMVKADGVNFSPVNNAGSGNIMTMGNNGVVVMDATSFAGGAGIYGIKGGSNALVYLTGSVYGGGSFTTLWSNFTGTVMSYDHLLTNVSVSALPTANAKFRGLRGSVTDGDSGLAWGATVTNSTTHNTAYEVWCNGSAWTVTGR